MKIPFVSIFDEEGNLNALNLVVLIGFIALVVFVFSVIGDQLAYTRDVAGQEMQMNDPDRVANLTTEVNNRYEGLEGQVENILSVRRQRDQLIEGLGARTTWPLDVADRYTQMNQQVLSLETAYHSSCSQFEAFVRDEGRNMALPDDLPRQCPQLPAAES